jgi:hypothetical protein
VPPDLGRLRSVVAGKIPRMTSWQCPSCGRRFDRTRQEHVCSDWTVEDHLEGKNDHVIDLFNRFVKVVERCGPFELTPTKTAIGLRGTRRGFAGLKLVEQGLDGFLDLPRRVDSPRFRRVSPYTQRLFVHRFRLTTAQELDEEFSGWLSEAYAVGQGRHLDAR